MVSLGGNRRDGQGSGDDDAAVAGMGWETQICTLEEIATAVMEDRTASRRVD